MTHEARIKVVGKHFESDSTVDFFTVGTVKTGDGCDIVEYNENEQTSEYRTTVTILDNCVIVNKIGEITHSMQFSPGRVCETVISTEMGDIAAEITTGKLNIARERGHITVEILYTITIDASISSHNKFTMRVNY